MFYVCRGHFVDDVDVLWMYGVCFIDNVDL